MDSPSESPKGVALKIDSINGNVIRAEYAVRGATAKRAAEISEDLKKGSKKYPFDEVLFCNIGNPHLVGQEPIPFYREVMAVVMDKGLLKSPSIPDGVKVRAKYYLDNIAGGIGAYSVSPGYQFVRERVAKFIERRDQTGIPVSADHIMLSDGASQSIDILLQTLVRDQDDGIMIPIPQYPLYTALLAVINCKPVPYYLDESNGWQVNIKELQDAYDVVRKKGTKVKAICVINPGNPTGQVLSEKSIREVIQFAVKNKVVIMADEVYQVNIYKEGLKFTSFRKVMSTMEHPYNKAELFSFHSTSKGLVGECGLRGGYMHWENINAEVEVQLKKFKSVFLCNNTVGQLMVDLMTNPPTKEENGEELANAFDEEYKIRMESLKRRAKMVTKHLNDMEGITSNEIEGAMYCFPNIHLPRGVIKEAKKKGISPDLLYALELLENTGLCGVEGSGFGQKEGTYHIRLTILVLPEDKFEQKLKVMKKFHSEFLKRYSNQ